MTQIKQQPRPKAERLDTETGAARLYSPRSSGTGIPIVRTAVETEADSEPRSVLFEYVRKATTPEMQAVIPISLATPSLEPARVTEPASKSWENAEELNTRVFNSKDTITTETPNRDRAVLVRVDGPSGGELTSLSTSQGNVLIGRSSKAQIHLTDSGVSRKHARISSERDALYLDDLGSSNGTFVAGRPVSRYLLRDGDLLRFGPRATFRFSFLDPQQETVLKRLYESNIYDPLTGAYNRSHFEERLTAELAYSVRHKVNAAIILFDLDFFRSVNGSYGYAAGDKVLKEVCRLAQMQLHADDVFSRYGGEELTVLLRGVSLAGAAHTANRIRLAVAEQPIDIGGIRVPVTISAGCATLSCINEPSVQAVITLADRRLYAAKRNGRNQVVMSGS